VRSPFREKSEAPRQPTAARGVEGTIELYPGHGFEFALEDLAAWRYIWVLFVFDRTQGWRPKVLPPRSDKRRGVFSTRSPHRPNPIGMSVVSLVRVEGLVIHIRDLDILDGTPVLDIKPYVAYSDSIADAGSGWLERDPGPAYEVAWEPRASEQLAWLKERDIDLRAPVEQALALGPAPHPYRRIRRDGDAFRLAWKEWRFWFTVEGTRVRVSRIGSGYRAREIHAGTAPAVHLEFAAKWETCPP